jgi:hypothetical protein
MGGGGGQEEHWEAYQSMLPEHLGRNAAIQSPTGEMQPICRLIGEMQPAPPYCLGGIATGMSAAGMSLIKENAASTPSKWECIRHVTYRGGIQPTRHLLWKMQQHVTYWGKCSWHVAYAW